MRDGDDARQVPEPLEVREGDRSRDEPAAVETGFQAGVAPHRRIPAVADEYHDASALDVLRALRSLPRTSTRDVVPPDREGVTCRRVERAHRRCDRGDRGVIRISQRQAAPSDGTSALHPCGERAVEGRVCCSPSEARTAMVKRRPVAARFGSSVLRPMPALGGSTMPTSATARTMAFLDLSWVVNGHLRVTGSPTAEEFRCMR